MSINFWDALFNTGDHICTADSIYDSVTKVFNSETWNHYVDAQFFCINPVTITRKDESITCYRNILIEFDNMGLDSQEQYVDEIEMPFTTQVFSGNKSYHYIISLEEPCKTLTEYKQLVARIHEKVKLADPSTKNASRLSRTANAKRDSGELQRYMDVKPRVSRSALETWLGPEKLKTETPKVSTPKQTGESRRRLLPVRVLAFMEYGAQEGGRNRALFINACELFRANYDKDEIYEIATRVLDLPDSEIRQCIASAQKAVNNETT